MTFTPCSQCRQIAAGPLKYCYATMFRGEERVSMRLKLCHLCFDDVFAPLEDISEVQQPNGAWLAPEERV